MHIALISVDFAPNVGGVAAHVVELGKALAAAGHPVTVITKPIGDMIEDQHNWQGMQVLRPHLPPRPAPLYNLALRFWLKRFLRTNPVDVIHVHGLRPLPSTGSLDIPVIFTNHTSGFLRRLDKGSGELRKLRKRMDHLAHVLAPSEELCEASRKVGYTGPVTFIANGVDTERFKPSASALRGEWGIETNEVVVLLARRLVDKNGVIVFADAVKALSTLPVRLVFAGDGPERGRVEDILRGNGMMERALFLGNVDNQRMPDIYNAADISVLPSFMEATSITGLESMATGLPLVGTRVGGIPALIDDGETGLLVEPGDPDGLGKAIRSLVEQPALRQAYGKAGREKAVAHFSWRRIAKRTADIYAQAINEHAR